MPCDRACELWLRILRLDLSLIDDAQAMILHRCSLALGPSRFQRFVIDSIPDEKDWCIPKFFNLRNYEQLIMMFGNVEQLSSAPGERTNAELKAHSAFTNRHATMVQQVMLPRSRWRIMPPSHRKNSERVC